MLLCRSREGYKAELARVTGRRVNTNRARTVIDNLLSARQLETTYYVTDSKQITDFVWSRDSGVQVNIGLRNINIIPVFDDVDHDVSGGSDVTPGRGADNEYFLNSPNSPDDRQHFRSVVSNQCRCVCRTTDVALALFT